MWTFREVNRGLKASPLFLEDGMVGVQRDYSYQLWRGNTKVIESFASESPLAFVQRCIQAINSHEEEANG